MGRNAKGTKTGGSLARTHKRRALVKDLLIGGLSEPEIVEQLALGQTYRGELIKADAKKVREDLQALGAEWRALHDDPDVLEREVGAIRARVREIAIRASRPSQITETRTVTHDGKTTTTTTVREVGPDYNASLRAEAFLLKLAQLRSPRWAPPEVVHGEARGPSAPSLTGPSVLPSEISPRLLQTVATVRTLDDAALVAFVEERRRRLGIPGPVLDGDELATRAKG